MIPLHSLACDQTFSYHYNDVIMTTMASQITSLTVVYSTVYSDANQRKHQSSASLAFAWGIHRDRWIPRTKGQLRGKCFHLMTSSCSSVVLVDSLFQIGFCFVGMVQTARKGVTIHFPVASCCVRMSSNIFLHISNITPYGNHGNRVTWTSTQMDRRRGHQVRNFIF